MSAELPPEPVEPLPSELPELPPPHESAGTSQSSWHSPQKMQSLAAM